jgi:hypothetical protein
VTALPRKVANVFGGVAGALGGRAPAFRAAVIWSAAIVSAAA